MTHELVRVSPAWLRLPEAADAAARQPVTISVAAWPHRCTLGPRRPDPPPLRPVADGSLASAAYG